MLTVNDIITGALENKILNHLRFRRFTKENYDKVEECWYLEEEEWTLDETGYSIYTDAEQAKIIKNIIALDDAQDMEALEKAIDLVATVIELNWHTKWDIAL